MPNTEVNWPNYVRVTDHVRIRSTLSTWWDDTVYFSLDEAEDLADYIKSAIDAARRNSQEIQELADCLEGVAVNSRSEALDIALGLHRKGYRKP